MEIEIDLKGLKVSNLALVALVVVLLILGIVGYHVTPAGGRVLTWDEWQLIKIRQAYRREVAVLQQAVERLAEAVNRGDDPLRAQMTADRVLRDLDAVTLAVLEPARGAVAGAAQAVRAWALGGDREAALQAVQEASGRVAEVSGGSLP